MEHSSTRNLFLHTVVQTLEKVSGPVFWIDVSGRVVHFNEELIKLTGFSSKLLRSASLQQLEPSLDVSSFEMRWGALRKKQLVSWETEFVNASGTKFPVKLNALQVAIDNMPLAFIHVESQAAFTSREEFLGNCLASHRVAACEWDFITNSFYVSNFFFELFELNKGQAISQANLPSLMKPHLTGKQLESLKAAMVELRNHPVDFEQEILLYHRNGTERKLLVSFNVLRKNELPLMLRGYVREMAAIDTSYRQTLARKLMDISPQMVFWINSNLSIHYANPAALHALGLTEHDLANGLQWSDIDATPLRQYWPQLFQELTTEKSRKLSLSLNKRSGKILFAECTFSFIEMEMDSMVHISALETSQELQDERTNRQRAVLENAQLSKRLELEKHALEKEIKLNHDNVTALNNNYKDMLWNLKKVAKTHFPVLIIGEPDSGKRLLAHTIHQLSNRSNYPFIKIDCTRFSQQTLEKELFGDEKNIFEVMSEKSIGHIEKAEGGTVVLDGICTISSNLQIKLLRLLQEGKYECLGSKKTRTANVRVVGTTIEDLERMVAEGKFNKRLFSQFKKGFVYNFINRNTSSEEEKTQMKHNQNDIITFSEPANSKQPNHLNGVAHPVVSLEEKQRQHILDALKLTKGKVSGKNGAAELLNINPQTLFSKMRKLGIKPIESMVELR